MSGRNFYLAPAERTDETFAMVFVLHPDGDRAVEMEVVRETDFTVALIADGELLAEASPATGAEVLVAMPDGRWLLGAAGAPDPEVLTVRLVPPITAR